MADPTIGDVADLVLAWRDDPVRFVIECLGATPSPQQAEALRSMAAPGSRTAIKSGHGTGKSVILTWTCLS